MIVHLADIDIFLWLINMKHQFFQQVVDHLLCACPVALIRTSCIATTEHTRQCFFAGYFTYLNH